MCFAAEEERAGGENTINCWYMLYEESAVGSRMCGKGAKLILFEDPTTKTPQGGGERTTANELLACVVRRGRHPLTATLLYAQARQRGKRQLKMERLTGYAPHTGTMFLSSGGATASR